METSFSCYIRYITNKGLTLRYFASRTYPGFPPSGKVSQAQTFFFGIFMKSLEELLALRTNAIGEESNKAGVYFLFSKKKIVYVGASNSSVKSRIIQHKSSKKFDSFAVIGCHFSDLYKLESDYIAKFVPKYNKELKRKDVYAQIGRVSGYPNQRIVAEISILGGRIYVKRSDIAELIDSYDEKEDNQMMFYPMGHFAHDNYGMPL